jgi:hypothetical protein
VSALTRSKRRRFLNVTRLPGIAGQARTAPFRRGPRSNRSPAHYQMFVSDALISCCIPPVGGITQSSVHLFGPTMRSHRHLQSLQPGENHLETILSMLFRQWDWASWQGDFGRPIFELIRLRRPLRARSRPQGSTLIVAPIKAQKHDLRLSLGRVCCKPGTHIVVV